MVLTSYDSSIGYPSSFLFIHMKTRATAENHTPTHVGQAFCSG